MTRFLTSMAFPLAGLVMLVATAAAGCGQALPVGASQPRVDIVYVGHPPVKAVLADVDGALQQYGDRVRVNRHDLDTPDGESFAKNRSVAAGSVLAIFINGSMDFQQGERQVKFFSFPVGTTGVKSTPGNWTMGDLESALAEAAGRKP